MSETYDALPDEPTGTWVVTTQHGTKIFFDFDDTVFLREAATRPDGSVNRFVTDGAWRRLGWGPYLARWTTDMGPEWIDDDGALGVRVGLAINYGESRAVDFWSTLVVSLAPCSDADAPPPDSPWAMEWHDDKWTSTAPGTGASGHGGTCDEALVDLGRVLDAWLDDLTSRGSSTRTARWYAARTDEHGSVVPWLLGNGVRLDEDEW